MKLQGDVDHGESCFGPFGVVLVLVQDRYMVCAKLPQAQESFWTKHMKLLDDETQVDARFSPSRDSANVDAR
jgi:hypothetical protein